jgi:XapX domain-containing protein
MSISAVLTTLLGGFLVGFVFSIFKLPLPVPPLAGLIAAAACLAGSASYQVVHSLLMRANANS